MEYAESMMGANCSAARTDVEILSRKMLSALTDDRLREWLESQVVFLNELEGQSREEFDLHQHRLEQLIGVQDEIDEIREKSVAVCPESVVNAFNLGEVLESGAYPETVFAWEPTTSSLSADNSTPPRWGVSGTRRRLRLAIPTPEAGEYPWSDNWPNRLSQLWLGATLPPTTRIDRIRTSTRPATADERLLVIESICGDAMAMFQQWDTPTLKVTDRLRIIDEGSRIISLDGRRHTLSRQPLVGVIKALLKSPTHCLSTTELQKLPGCKGPGTLSKLVKSLPSELHGIVKGTPKAGVYELSLPPIVGCV